MSTLAFKIAEDEKGEGVWVTPEDFQMILQDEFVYGDAFVQPLQEDDPIVTHRRVPPPLARKWSAA